MVREIESEKELNDIIADLKGLVVLDAYATWCVPCKALAPKLNDMAMKYPDVLFLKIDVDRFSSFAEEYNITAMPTILFFKNKIEMSRVIGTNEKEILQNIEKLM